MLPATPYTPYTGGPEALPRHDVAGLNRHIAPNRVFSEALDVDLLRN